MRPSPVPNLKLNSLQDSGQGGLTSLTKALANLLLASMLTVSVAFNFVGVEVNYRQRTTVMGTIQNLNVTAYKTIRTSKSEVKMDFSVKFQSGFNPRLRKGESIRSISPVPNLKLNSWQDSGQGVD